MPTSPRTQMERGDYTPPFWCVAREALAHFSLSSLFSSLMKVLMSLNCLYTEAKRT